VETDIRAGSGILQPLYSAQDLRATLDGGQRLRLEVHRDRTLGMLLLFLGTVPYTSSLAFAV
jgi:hypothetical protein